MEEIRIEFRFKDLKVWQKSMDYADKVIALSENLNSDTKHYRLIQQLEACSASVAQNIAEGKGRNSKKEFVQFLYIARGSLYESVTLLNLFEKRGWISNEELYKCETEAHEIARMIKGLINSLYRE